MTMKDVMNQRHVVRKFTNKPISEELVKKLNDRVSDDNEKSGLSMKLVINNSKGLNTVAKMFFAKGVKNYVILAGSDSENLNEKLGYYGADIMLYAQTNGLNTWWIGSTFNRNVDKIVPGNKVIGIIAVGYGATQGVAHKSKTSAEVSEYMGEEPEWFKQGVQAALLAPTAMNKQPFKLVGKDTNVNITCDGDGFTGVDTGIVKYHFELGAGNSNFLWH